MRACASAHCEVEHVDLRDDDMDQMDARMNFVFEDQDNILRNRLFLGAKVKYYVFTLSLEASFALGGSSEDDRKGTDLSCADVDPAMPTTACDAVDRSAAQSNINVGLGLDF